MGGWGGQNPWPFQWGGGTTDIEDTHKAIRANRGIGGSGPEGGLEDAWLWEEAAALVANEKAVERAALQEFPFLATDHIPVYEMRFGLPPLGTLQDRRAAIDLFVAQEARADVPSLEQELLAISPFLGFEIPTRAQSTLTLQGKTLAPRVAGFPSYGGRVSSNYANYADEFIFHVTWDVVGAGTALPNDGVTAAVIRLMNERLPAWQDWVFHQLGGGFFFDGGADGLSLFDWSAFGAP